MARVFDTHLHTVRGGDGSLTARELVEEAIRLGIDGICITEHGQFWDHRELAQLADGTGLVLIRGTEFATDMGHINVFGIDHYPSGWYRARDLCRSVRDSGGYTIGVHPFRRAFYAESFYFKPADYVRPTLDTAVTNPVLEQVDAIEVLNGACTDVENLLALAVARRLGRPATAGSDAHSTLGIGCFVTVFENDIQTEEEFLRELKAGRFHAARGLIDGKLLPYAVTEEEMLAGLRFYDLV